MQELVSPLGYDVRVVVAGGKVVGSIRRRAAPGEWRTNVALGGRRVKARPAPAACELALAAAAAIDADLVEIDLLPLPGGGYVVLEANGAVDFGPEYSPGDVFADAMSALCAAARGTGAADLAAAATA